MITVLIGPPGSGKGTIGQHLATQGHSHIATGNFIREHYQQTGQLMDDAMIEDRLHNSLKSVNPILGDVVLDGYPRSVEQIHSLDAIVNDIGEQIRRVICLEISPERLVERILGRYSCSACGTIYHRSSVPVEDNKCHCGSESFSTRHDDNLETLSIRLERYRERCLPMLEIYHARGLLCSINADRPVEDIMAEL